MAAELFITRADYENAGHAADIIALLDAYARDPMGGGKPLNAEVRERLVSELSRRPFALSILAYVDGKPAGLVNAFEGFSTFKAKPLLNLHDIVVLPEFRKQGIALAMMEKAQAIARERGCCKLTLEVLSGNAPALSAYQRFGFENYQLDPTVGQAMFLEKPL